jgi:hypothetical protein
VPTAKIVKGFYAQYKSKIMSYVARLYHDGSNLLFVCGYASNSTIPDDGAAGDNYFLNTKTKPAGTGALFVVRVGAIHIHIQIGLQLITPATMGLKYIKF